MENVTYASPKALLQKSLPYIQVTGSHSQLCCKQVDKNQNYSTATVVKRVYPISTGRKLRTEITMRKLAQ